MPSHNFPFSFDFLNPSKLPEGTQQSAQEIWLAGLGAFAKAQKDGENAFQKLVQDGVSMQKKNQEDAQRKLAEATEKMTALASGNFGKLEGIFEDRVARALKQLGVPTADEVQALRDEVAALKAQVKALSGKAAPAPAAKTAATKTSSSKAATKKTGAKGPLGRTGKNGG
jgi:poly(hydroxyalkanoate) granule-associated protein